MKTGNGAGNKPQSKTAFTAHDCRIIIPAGKTNYKSAGFRFLRPALIPNEFILLQPPFWAALFRRAHAVLNAFYAMVVLQTAFAADWGSRFFSPAQSG